MASKSKENQWLFNAVQPQMQKCDKSRCCFDPISQKHIDFVDGRSDIEKKVIRAIGDPDLRFQEDHLRLLRAVRFAARFNYEIEENDQVHKNNEKPKYPTKDV